MEARTFGLDGAPDLTVDAFCDRLARDDERFHAFVAEAETGAARRQRMRAELGALQHLTAPDRDRTDPNGTDPHSSDRGRPDADRQDWAPDRGRAEGARSDQPPPHRPRPRPTPPPLFGVPVAVKDIVRVDGLPTRAGSRLPPEVFAGPQAAVVDRLRAAGAVIAGKTVTAEFAMSAPGPTRNPRAPDRTPGGSSSGSAAAVAAGTVPLALGTQTVGSMIRPAAYCGVVGFKPTAGRIPFDGVVPNAPTLDTLGIFAATPGAAEQAAAVLCDDWHPVPAADIRRSPVFGVPEGPYLEQAGPQARAALERQVASLGRAGFEVRRVPLPTGDHTGTGAPSHRGHGTRGARDLAEDLFAVNRYEAARSHAAWFPRFGDLYREQSAATVRQGLAISRARYEEALRGRDAFRTALAAATERAGVDIWLCPATTGPAPYGLTSTGDPTMCRPWSFAGWPALSLPLGRTPDGLPLGSQWVARAHWDERLLRWAGTVAPLVSAPPR